MSLHLGNLSSRVRRDELERVFRRFGRCSVQIKDKYGFVVYDYPVNAERALKTLGGKKICGEPLTLSWSNRQPRPLPRVRRGRSYDSQRRRNSVKDNYVNRKFSSDGRHDFRIGYKKTDAASRMSTPADLLEDERNRGPDNEKVYGVEEELSDEGRNFVENDRWGEQMSGNGLENGSDFDRYEPYSGDEDEIKAKDSQHRKEVVQIGNANSEPFDSAKTQLECYNCGDTGHKMRDCPQEKASRKKLNKFDRNQSDKSNYSSKGEDELKRVESESRERQRQNSREAVTIRSHKGDRELASGRKHHHGSREKEHERTKRTRESVSPGMHRARKSRRQPPSPISISLSSSSSSTSSSKSRTHKSKLDTGTSLENGKEMGQFQIDKDMNTNHKSEKETHLDEGIYSCDRLFDKGGLTEDISPPTSHTVMGDLQVFSSQNHESEVDLGIHRTNKSTSIITSEEMLMVLKHYGLNQPGAADNDLPAESVFGSARLWPWEIIYYRRLKKGPISVENYARRIAQNKEFGIIDKYIRSSSGWGELGKR